MSSSVPGLSSSGPSAPFSLDSGPGLSKFGSSILIEEVVNEFSQCRPHRFQIANIFSQ